MKNKTNYGDSLLKEVSDKDIAKIQSMIEKSLDKGLAIPEELGLALAESVGDLEQMKYQLVAFAIKHSSEPLHFIKDIMKMILQK